ncbi:MAG TPA: pilus assembly protein TadG-related protein [Dehalococcoidia bacterium]|nr:pilus assembly protein TadG-related protein [Dehalococcoidia bacterium]
MRLLSLFRRRERGQFLMIGALLLPVLLGMAGMAVDVGKYADERRNLQNAADAIALAASQQMCTPNPNDCSNTTAATTAANAIATKNGINTSDMTVTYLGGNTAPKARVSITRNHKFQFIRILGINNKNVSGKAAAAKVSFGGGSGVVPWAVTQSTVDQAGVGNLVTMKYDATGANNGNFGAIRIDGSGAATYRSDVKYGANSFICAVGTPNCSTGACPGTYPSGCAETAPSCDGPECSPETGNMVGPTKDGVDFRMSNTSTACDTFAEAFGTPDPGTGLYHLASQCNPWLEGNQCPQTATPCSRRVIIIPIIDQFGNGASDPLTIQSFALMYLEGYDNGKCQGNSCEIKGEFVKADINARALAGTYDPEASITFTKLVE